MRRIVLLHTLLAMCLTIGWGCDPKKTVDPPDPRKECTNDTACWKKVCTQTNQDDYDACVKKELDNTNGSPTYHVCGTDNKCSTIADTELGNGKVDVTFPDETKEAIAKDQVKWLRLFIFPGKDHDGNAITCDRIKQMAASNPEELMSTTLGRYYPPPSWEKPITTEVIRTGDSINLLYPDVTVPAGSTHVFVLQGFCNPIEGRPDIKTEHKWLGCQEKVSTKAGKDMTTVNLILPVQNGDRCNP